MLGSIPTSDEWMQGPRHGYQMNDTGGAIGTWYLVDAVVDGGINYCPFADLATEHNQNFILVEAVGSSPSTTLF